jgi:fumarate reductase subunit D
MWCVWVLHAAGSDTASIWSPACILIVRSLCSAGAPDFSWAEDRQGPRTGQGRSSTPSCLSVFFFHSIVQCMLHALHAFSHSSHSSVILTELSLLVSLFVLAGSPHHSRAEGRQGPRTWQGPQQQLRRQYRAVQLIRAAAVP